MIRIGRDIWAAPATIAGVTCEREPSDDHQWHVFAITIAGARIWAASYGGEEPIGSTLTDGETEARAHAARLAEQIACDRAETVHT